MATSTWKGVTGIWTTASDWTGGVPTNDGTAVALLKSETTAYTVTSSGSVQLDYLSVGDDATLSLTGGDFSVDSTDNIYSVISVYDALKVGAGATLSLGNSTAGDSGVIQGPGSVSVAKGGQIVLSAPWSGLFGAKIKLAGGDVTGAATGSQTLYNDNAVISGYGEIVGSATSGTIETVQVGATSIASGDDLYLTNANQATIDATGAAGDYLLLFTGINAIENNGLLETTGAGGLVIASTMHQDGSLVAKGTGAVTILGAEVEGDGTTTIDAGGSIVLGNGQIDSGGAFNIAATGKLTNTAGDLTDVSSSNAFAGDVIDTTIANSGSIVVAANSVLNDAAIVLNTSSGQIDLNGSSAGTATLELFASGASVYGGKIVLSKTGQNLIDANGVGEQFSNNAVITGAGAIGDGWLRLYNGVTGVIDANVAAGIAIYGDAQAVNASSESANYNAGLVEAAGVGVLTIDGAFDNAGTIDAAGGTVILNGADDSSGGGLVETSGKGVIVLENGAYISHNDYISIASGGLLTTGALENAQASAVKSDLVVSNSDTVLENVSWNGAVAVVGNSTLIVDAHWQGSGVITVGSAGAAATIEIAAENSWSLLGGGKLELLNAGDSITGAGAGTALSFRGITVVGAGTLGDDNMSVNNEGGSTIDATGVMTLIATNNTANTKLNNGGLIEATGGGGLTLEGAMYNSGQIIAATGSSIIADDAVYGSGVVDIQGSGVATFDAELDNDVVFGAKATGTLNLGPAAQPFNGNIYGFAAGDTIDLQGFVLTGDSINFGGNLSGNITLSGTIKGSDVTETLYFEGNYVGKSWSIGGDNNGGTKITL